MIKKFIIVLMALFFGASSGVLHSAPGDFGFRFNHSSIGVRDVTINYGPVFAGAGTEFANAGGFSFYTAPANLNPPFSGHVAFWEANFGATDWRGAARSWNNLDQQCLDWVTGVSTGICNMSSGADYGVVMFNLFYEPNPSIATMNFLIRHEFGHILGMTHDSCNPNYGVMAPSSMCQPSRTTLQPVDINLINSWY